VATIISSQQTIGTTPTRIAMGLVGASYVYLHAPTGGGEIYIGNSDVTTSNGFALPKNEMHEIWLPENDKLMLSWHQVQNFSMSYIQEAANVLRDARSVQGCGWHYR